MAQTGSSKKIDSSKLSTINDLIQKLGLILADLLTASRSTADPVELMQIAAEYRAVQSCLDKAAQGQVAANDALFKQATGVLQSQAKMLEDMEKSIKKIIKDVALVGRIGGYLADALTLIAKL